MKNENNAVPAGPIAYAVYGIDAAGKHYLRAVKPIEAGEDWKIDDDCLGDRWSGNEALSAVAPSDLQGLADALKFKRDCPKCGHVFADPECTRAADVLERLSASEPSDATGKADAAKLSVGVHANGVTVHVSVHLKQADQTTVLYSQAHPDCRETAGIVSLPSHLFASQSPATSAADAKDAERIADLERQLAVCLAATAKWSAAAGAASLDAERYRWLRASGPEFDSLSILDTRGGIIPEALDRAIDAAIAATTQAAPVAKGADCLTPEELAFVELVRQRPGHKLNGGEAFGPDGWALWKRPEELGLIRTVGSYKWVVQAQSSAKGGDAVGGENV